MTSVDELRRVLGEQAERTAGDDGLLEVVRIGARRRLRRRNMLRATIVFIVVATIAVTVPAVVASRAGRIPGHHPIPTPTLSLRQPGQFTIDIAPADLAVRAFFEASGRGQILSSKAGSVHGYDDDPPFIADLLAGEPVTVGDRQAYYVRSWANPPVRTTTGKTVQFSSQLIGWRNPYGGWVVIALDANQDNRADLIQALSRVIVRPPYYQPSPVHFGYLRPGDELLSFDTQADTPIQDMTIGPPSSDPNHPAIGVMISPRGRFVGLHGQPQIINGFQAYFPNETQALIRTATCDVEVTGTTGVVSQADIRNMVEHMSVADCGHRETWGTPVG